MSKVDKIKEEIGWLKTVFSLLTVMDISMVGYLFAKYAELSDIKFFFVIISINIASISAILITFIAYHKIDKLEDL